MSLLRISRCVTRPAAVKRGQHSGLAVKAREALRRLGKYAGQELDRDVAAQRGVGGAPDGTHTALADLFDETVVRQLLTWLDAHL